MKAKKENSLCNSASLVEGSKNFDGQSPVLA